MIRQAELLPLTGYVHGGCSPLGMKKQLKTFLDESARDLETMVVSAGKIGAQVELAPGDLGRPRPGGPGSPRPRSNARCTRNAIPA